MKRNVTLGLCGAAAIAIVTAALLRPALAQSVEDDNSSDDLRSTLTQAFSAPSAGAPAAATSGMPVANAAPAASGDSVVTYGSAGGADAYVRTVLPAEPDPIDPFGRAARGRNFTTTYAHFPQGNHPPLQQLAAAVRGAKDDAARAAATAQMQKTLNDTFDADMKRREQELTQLEERLKALRQQMTRRQEKKGEIIELQSRVLLNEADGLGFYSTGEAVYAQPAPSELWNSDSYAPSAEPVFGGQLPAPADPVPDATPPAAGGF